MEAIAALELVRLRVAERHGQALGVVAFRKRDGRRHLAVEVVLLEQPGRPEIPPLGAVEQEIEARVLQPQHLLGRAAEGLGEEPAARRLGLGSADDPLPDLRRHLIGGIAAKAVEAEIEVVPDQLDPVGDLRRSHIHVVVVDLGEVAPHGELSRIDRVDRAW